MALFVFEQANDDFLTEGKCKGQRFLHKNGCGWTDEAANSYELWRNGSSFMNQPRYVQSNHMEKHGTRSEANSTSRNVLMIRPFHRVTVGKQSMTISSTAANGPVCTWRGSEHRIKCSVPRERPVSPCLWSIYGHTMFDLVDRNNQSMCGKPKALQVTFQLEYISYKDGNFLNVTHDIQYPSTTVKVCFFSIFPQPQTFY